MLSTLSKSVGKIHETTCYPCLSSGCIYFNSNSLETIAVSVYTVLQWLSVHISTACSIAIACLWSLFEFCQLQLTVFDVVHRSARQFASILGDGDEKKEIASRLAKVGFVLFVWPSQLS